MARSWVWAMGLLALCAGTAVQAAGDPTESLPGVIDLTPATFSQYVNSAKAVLVEFYAPWCGHCKHLVPEYRKLGELVAADPALRNRVTIAKVDADAHRSIGSQFGVQGFPTIKFFARGKPVTKEHVKDYQGARTADAFITWLKNELAADEGFGRVEALQALVKGFVESKDKAGVLKQVRSAVSSLTGEDAVNGQVYVKVLEKAVDKGAEWLTKERARLTKLLSAGSLVASKVEEMGRKLSVIGGVLGADHDEPQAAV